MTVHPVTAHPLLRGLFDDASLFPPASLKMTAAVAAHAKHSASWFAPVCGPFVCAETRLGELRTVLQATGTMPIDLALVVTGGAAAVPAALDAAAADPRLRLRAVEVPATGAVAAPDPVEAVSAVAQALDNSPLAVAVGYIEPPLAALTDPAIADQVLAITDNRGYRPKLRTGGTTAAAFPDEQTLATCLEVLVDRRLPFKCTAGLHHAVRHTAADTGFEHHGFLNVLLAVGAASQGANRAELAKLLAERDPVAVARQIGDLDGMDADDIRYLFTSFGTCSIEEPVQDLIALGLLSP
ncbi:MAG TPA: hypothetical protein VFI65_09510 [Streptosporangiaceae bacterium]|nr:hypothetical protein [Streptosporangiaceae bacterium]